jgi:hypothetical protein
MKREEVMEMAYESGVIAGYEGEPDLLERFAELVARRALDSSYPEMVAIVAAQEREACAAVCDARYMGDNNREDMEARRCAAAIRARGQEMERKPANANDKAYSEVELANAYQKGWDDAMLRRSIGARSQA